MEMLKRLEKPFLLIIKKIGGKNMQEDIRRTVLFLINGFGVDKRDIYDILNDNTVPYINKLARENIYTTMPSIATDYKTGFRMFSIGQKDLPGYKKLGEDMLSKFEKNERFNNR